jgi:hypothetical protein
MALDVAWYTWRLLGVALLVLSFWVANRGLEKGLKVIINQLSRRGLDKYLACKPEVTIGHNFIVIQDIEPSRALLDIVDKLCHDSCNFIKFRLGTIRIQLIPAISVEVSDLTVQMVAKYPDKWSTENVLEAMRLRRSAVIDVLTDRLNSRRKRKYFGDILITIARSLSSIVDCIIASARLTMTNIRVGYKLNRSVRTKSNAITARIGELLVTPMPLSVEYFTSKGFQVLKLTTVMRADSTLIIRC